MKIQIKYFKLVEDKKMGDGNLISKDQKLIFIKKDDGMLQFETEDEHKIIFWTNESEVNFIEEIDEEWEEEKINERNCYINGEFL